MKAQSPQHNKYGDIKIPKSLQTQYEVYHFKRIVDGATLIYQAAGSTTLGAFNFQLAGVDNYTDFTNLFDQYRIDYIVVRFRPQFNMASFASFSSTTIPTLYTVIDMDDSNTPASLAELRQYQTLRESKFDRTISRTLQPRCASALYSGAFTSYSTVRPWVDCASSAVQWYGVKFGITAGQVGQTALQAWSIEVEYFFSFKFVR